MVTSTFIQDENSADVIIHANTVIGLDGFGYARNELGELEKFPHIGGVLIEDNVEIASNTTVQRGALGETVIRQGTKIDSHVHVGHNSITARHTVVTAHAMIGGSVQIGDYTWVGAGAMLKNGITIGSHAVVGLGAVVVKDVPTARRLWACQLGRLPNTNGLCEVYVGWLQKNRKALRRRSSSLRQQFSGHRSVRDSQGGI